MTKQFSILLCFIFSSILFSQNHTDAIIINSENDTIRSKIKIYGNLFNSANVDIRSFYDTVILLDDNLKVKQKIKSKNIKELIFNDNLGQTLSFVNNKGSLEQVLFKGKKLKWLRSFTRNMYDGSLSSNDYIITENNEIVKLGGLGSRRKTRLKEVTKLKPELAAKIDNLETYNVAAVKELLSQYEE